MGRIPYKVFTYGEHAELSDGAFKESGTNTKCVMVSMTKYSDSKIQEFETEKTYDCTWDIFTGRILVAPQSDSGWCYPVDKLVERVKLGRLTSESLFQTELDTLCDHIVRQKVEHEECSFRWDKLIRERVVHYAFENIIEDHFDCVNPFTSRKSRQLSLF